MSEMGFGKQLIYPSRDHKGIYTFLIDEPADQMHLIKTAAEYHPQVSAYIKNAKPMPGYVQVLITALGAGEYWGSNINGDFFPVSGLAPVDKMYGHKTFEYYAKVRKHHMNKDYHPSYGDVLLSVWNDKMKRVELIIRVSEKDAPDLAQRLARGETVDWSMGAKLVYDECSKCHHQSKKIEEYCHHLKFMMNKIDPETGRQIYAINPRPRFFDISHVLIGADRTNATWVKVASASNWPIDLDVPHRTVSSGILYREGFEKVASQKVAEVKYAGLKHASITKRVDSNIRPQLNENITKYIGPLAKALQASSSSLPKKTILQLSKSPAPNVFNTMHTLGIVPKPQEFQGIVLRAMGQSALAEELEKKNLSFDPAEGIGKNLSMPAGSFDADVARILAPFLADRSYSRPVLMKRIILIKEGAAGKVSEPTFVKSSQVHIPVLATLAALFTMMSWKHLGQSPANLGLILKDNPILLASMGAGVLAGTATMMDAPLRPVGNFDVASGPKPLYNNQQRLALLEKMQQRPVLMIKAGSATSSAQESRLFHGLPSLFLAAANCSHQSGAPDFQAAFSKVATLSEGFLAADSETLKRAYEAMLGSFRFIGKVASADDLALYPDDLRTTIADLVILTS